VKLSEFYGTLYDDLENLKITCSNEESLNRYSKMFLDDLITILDTKFDVINICIEIFLLLSYIANQNLYFKSLLEKSESFMKVMQKIITLYAVKLKKIYLIT
jgi:hypothetical protein